MDAIASKVAAALAVINLDVEPVISVDGPAASPEAAAVSAASEISGAGGASDLTRNHQAAKATKRMPSSTMTAVRLDRFVAMPRP